MANEVALSKLQLARDLMKYTETGPLRDALAKVIEAVKELAEQAPTSTPRP